jgi:hypothetical protein
MQEIGEMARERAWMIQEHGMNIGQRGQHLFTGGAGDWAAPKIHPVWAPEVAHEARTLQRMGAPTFEYEPLYEKLQTWDMAQPSRGMDDRSEMLYGALNGIEDDRQEEHDSYGLAQLHDRMDAMQQAKEQEQQRGHEHGMGM